MNFDLKLYAQEDRVYFCYYLSKFRLWLLLLISAIQEGRHVNDRAENSSKLRLLYEKIPQKNLDMEQCSVFVSFHPVMLLMHILSSTLPFSIVFPHI